MMKFALTEEIANIFVKESRTRTVEAVLFGSPILREKDGEDQSVLATWAWTVSKDESAQGDVKAGTDSPTESFDFYSDFWSAPKMGNLQEAFKNVTRVLPGGWVVTGFIVSPEYDALQRALEFRDACQKWNPNCQFTTQLVLQSIAPSADGGIPDYLSYCLDGESESLIECSPKCPLAVVPIGEMMRDLRLFRIRGKLPLSYCINESYTQTTLWEEAEYLKNRVLSNCSAFRVKHVPDILLRSSVRESAEELDDKNVEGIWRQVLKRREEDDELFGKQQGHNFNCTLDLKLLFNLGEETSYNDFLAHAPTIKQEICYGIGVSCEIEVDCLAIIPLSTLSMMLLPILRHSVAYHVKRAALWLGKAAKAKGIDQKAIERLRPVHVLAGSLGFPVSLLYPVGVDENHSSMVAYRKTLHESFLLPEDGPVFRLGNQHFFYDDLRALGKLINPHEAVVGKSDRIACVKGRYIYFHYMQDMLNDDGWGCAYRSLQTLASWFRLQGYSTRSVPTHREIQQCLVDIGDKEPRFVGSKQWIGSSEVGYVLEKLYGVTHRISHARTGEEMVFKARELKVHFETQGTPVMIGGGDLAHTILGIDFNDETGDVRFLVLDPHYTGDENLKVITTKGWCAWKNPSFWKPNVFYNMCLPQRPEVSV